MLKTYCEGCHNARAKTGGLALDTLDLQHPAAHAEIWEKVLRKLRGQTTDTGEEATIRVLAAGRLGKRDRSRRSSRCRVADRR